MLSEIAIVAVIVFVVVVCVIVIAGARMRTHVFGGSTKSVDVLENIADKIACELAKIQEYLIYYEEVGDCPDNDENSILDARVRSLVDKYNRLDKQLKNVDQQLRQARSATDRASVDYFRKRELKVGQARAAARLELGPASCN